VVGQAASLFNLRLGPSDKQGGLSARLFYAGGSADYTAALPMFSVSDSEAHNVASPITLGVSPITVPGRLLEGCGPSTPLDQASFSLKLDTGSSAYVAAAVSSASGTWNNAACSLSISWPSPPSLPVGTVKLLLAAVTAQLEEKVKTPKLSTDYDFYVNLTMIDNCTTGYQRCPASSSDNITASASIPAFTYRRSAPADATFVRCAPASSSDSADVLMVEGRDTAVFQCLSINTTSTTTAFSAGNVVLASGCSAADTLILPQAAVTAFVSATASGPVPLAGNYTGCPIVLPLLRIGPPAAYTALFSSILLSVSPSNDQPLLSALTGSPSPTDTGRRIIYFSVDIAGVGTAGFTSVRVAVTPVNNPPLWPAAPVNHLVGSTASASSLLVEGTLPTLSVFIAQNCSSSGLVRARSVSAASGAAVVCIEDPDPVTIAGGTALETAMTGAGGRNSSGGFALASRLPIGDESSVPLLTVGDYDLTLSLSSTSLASAAPAWVHSSPVLLTSSYVADCAGDTLAPTNATSAGISTTGDADPFAVLTPCWRASYSLASVPSFDRENATHPIWLRYSLTLTDTFTLDPASPTLTLTGSVNVSVADVDEPGTLAFVPPLSNATAKLRLDAAWGATFSSPLSAQANEVLLDEATGQPVFGFDAPLRVKDADGGRTHAILLEALSPLDGSDPFVLAPLAQLLVARRTSPSAVWNAQLGTWTEAFSVVPASAGVASSLASSLLVKQLTVRACAVQEPVGGATGDGSNTGGLTSCPATAPSLPLTLLLVRSNAPLTPAQPTLSASVPENTPPGTVLLSINASDGDPGQSFSFLFSATGLPTWGPFLLRPTLTPYSTTDRATGAAVTLSLARRAELVVAQDALDYEDSTARSWAGDIVVSDDGRFPESSLLPPALPTSANVTLTLSVSDVPDVPVVTTVDGIPEGGLSVWGGDVLELVGTGLGLPSGTASTVTATLVNGSLSFPLLGCVVVTRLTRVRCTAPPGYGYGFGVAVTVSGQTSPTAPVPVPRLAYQAPRVLSVSSPAVLLSALPGPGTAPGGNVSSSGSTITILGTGFPSAANPSLLSAFLVDGSRYGCVSTNATDCATPARVPLVGCTVGPSTAPDAPAGAAMLTCAVPPGAGAGLHVVVDVDGRTSLPPLASYARPVIQRLVQGPAAAAIVGGDVDPFAFVLEGTDLGEDAAALDWVEHAADPFLNDTASCPATVGTYASCAFHRAQRCVHLLPFTRIRCLLDPSGYGVGFAVRVSVRGQVSAWSSQTASRAEETFLSYPPPVLTNVTFVDTVSGTPTYAATSGKTLLRLLGTGFASSFGATNVTIGGIPVTPLDGWAIPTATDEASAAAGTGGGQSGGPPRALVAGSSSWTTALLVFAPPGLGTVSVVVRVGNRTTASTLTYTPLRIQDTNTFAFKFGSLAAESRKGFTIAGGGFAICAICASPNAVVGNCGTSQSCGRIFDIALGGRTCYTKSSENATSTVAGLPVADPAAAIRKVCALPVSDIAVPNATTASALPSLSVSVGPDVANITMVSELDDVLFLSTYAESGPLVIAAEWPAVSKNVSKFFDFFSLLENNPVFKAPPKPEKWPTKGGNEVTLTLDNAGSTGDVFIRPEGGNLTSGLGKSFSGAFRCPIVWTTKAPTSATPAFQNSAYWKGELLLPEVNDTGTSTSYDLTVEAQRQAAASVIQAANFSTRVAFDGTKWNLYRALPCYITTWAGAETGTNHIVKFRTPAWAGSVVVSLEGTAGPVLGGQQVSYIGPDIVSVTSVNTNSSEAIMPTDGTGLLKISGTDLGEGVSLREMWDSQNGGWYDGTSPYASNDYPHSVVISYTGDSSAKTVRLCVPVSWSSTSIICRAPPGVSGSENDITVKLNTSSSGGNAPNGGKVIQITSSRAFKYRDPTLHPLAVANGPTVGGYPVTVTGTDLSTLDIAGLYASARESELARRNGGVYGGSPFWSPRIYFAGDAPDPTRVSGGKDAIGRVERDLSYTLGIETDVRDRATANGTAPGSSFYGQSIISLNDTTLVFLMPVIEGNVTFRLEFASTDGRKASSKEVKFSADPPRIFSVAAIAPSSSSNTSLDHDPCLALNSTDLRDENIRSAYEEVYRWPSYPAVFVNEATRTVSPCFRANASGSSLTRLQISGTGFGTGSAPTSVQRVSILPLSAPSSDERYWFACSPITGKTALLDDSTLQCDVNENLPRGRVDIRVDMAWRTVRSSDFGILPYAVCPSGSFAETDGVLCQPCSTGASCAGALEPRRAIAGYWKTIDREWDSRSINNTVVGAEPFVPCAVKALCMPNNKCTETSGDWMCVKCAENSTHTYKRTLSGTCSKCDDVETIGVKVAVFVVPLILLSALYVFLFIAAERTRRRNGKVTMCRPFGNAVRGARERLCPSRGGAAPMHPALAALVSAPAAIAGGLAYVVTCEWSRSPPRECDDPSLVTVPVLFGLCRCLCCRVRKPKPKEGKRRDSPSFITLFKLFLTFTQTLAAIAAYAEPSKLNGEPKKEDPFIIPIGACEARRCTLLSPISCLSLLPPPSR
jgi:hypothetical protein